VRGSSPQAIAAGCLPRCTLTLGARLRGTPAESADITSFARLVRQFSDGRMTIRIMWEAQAANPGRDRARASWHHGPGLDRRGARTPGVCSLQALQAPFLIDSYPLLGRLRSPMGQRHARRAEPGRGTPLGLYPDQLRHPAGFRKPLASLRSWGARPSRPRASEALRSARWARCR
jgi:hypothetical protein